MTSPNWKQCKCPSAVGDTMNGGGGHLVEYYAVTKKHKPLLHTTMMNLKIIMLGVGER